MRIREEAAHSGWTSRVDRPAAERLAQGACCGSERGAGILPKLNEITPEISPFLLCALLDCAPLRNESSAAGCCRETQPVEQGMWCRDLSLVSRPLQWEPAIQTNRDGARGQLGAGGSSPWMIEFPELEFCHDASISANRRVSPLTGRERSPLKLFGSFITYPSTFPIPQCSKCQCSLELPCIRLHCSASSYCMLIPPSVHRITLLTSLPRSIPLITHFELVSSASIQFSILISVLIVIHLHC
ncbi:uncharacterized protein VTP21DRAFT_9963 [Calcarisporiella thermophila]|uniref:uncharacterized protein n=1 Tax=Calcarisporiella thermophila TaxID=911321 RepID=UPI0037441B1C